jgi:hypothetical protein
VNLECSDAGGIVIDRYTEPGELVGNASYIVGIVGTDAQLDQPAGRALHDAELFATVAGRKARTVSG